MGHCRIRTYQRSAGGWATLINRVSTGETEYEGHAFIVHSNGDGRVACGLLESSSMMVVDPTDAGLIREKKCDEEK